MKIPNGSFKNKSNAAWARYRIGEAVIKIVRTDDGKLELFELEEVRGLRGAKLAYCLAQLAADQGVTPAQFERQICRSLAAVIEADGR